MVNQKPQYTAYMAYTHELNMRRLARSHDESGKVMAKILMTMHDTQPPNVGGREAVFKWGLIEKLTEGLVLQGRCFVSA